MNYFTKAYVPYLNSRVYHSCPLIMFKNGLKLFCCATEDESDAQQINWTDNILTKEIIKTRQANIAKLAKAAMEDAMRHRIVEEEPRAASGRERSKSEHVSKHPVFKQINTKKIHQFPVIASLRTMTKSSNIKITDYL